MLKNIDTKSALLILVILFICVFMGLFSVVYASLVGERYGLLLAFPAAILIGILFLYDRYLFFMLVILFRSSMDVVFANTKLGSFGLGAVLNALVILIAIIALFEHPKPARRVLYSTWLPFLVIVFISLIYTPDFLTGVKTFLALVSHAAIFAMAIVVVRNEHDYGKWMRAVFLSSLIPVAYAFVDIALGGFHNGNEEGFRISSTFSHPNVFAFYLVLMISVGFYFYKSNVSYIPAFFRRLIPLYILVLFALLVLTKTRSAWAACFAFFAIYALLYERKYLIYLMFVPVIAFLIPDIRERFMDLTQGNEVINYSKLNSYAWRKLIWHDGIAWMETSRYILGYGIESFKHLSIDFFTMAGGRRMGAHSVYVQLFFEIGALGLMAFIWLYVSVIRKLLPFYKQNKLMIFSAIMLIMEFGFEAYSDNMLDYLCFIWYMWFVLGAAYAVNYQMQQSKVNQLEPTI